VRTGWFPFFFCFSFDFFFFFSTIPVPLKVEDSFSFFLFFFFPNFTGRQQKTNVCVKKRLTLFFSFFLFLSSINGEPFVPFYFSFFPPPIKLLCGEVTKEGAGPPPPRVLAPSARDLFPPPPPFFPMGSTDRSCVGLGVNVRGFPPLSFFFFFPLFSSPFRFRAREGEMSVPFFFFFPFFFFMDSPPLFVNSKHR